MLYVILYLFASSLDWFEFIGIAGFTCNTITYFIIYIMDQKKKYFVHSQECMEPKSKRQTIYSKKYRYKHLAIQDKKKKKNYICGCLVEYAADGRWKKKKKEKKKCFNVGWRWRLNTKCI